VGTHGDHADVDKDGGMKPGPYTAWLPLRDELIVDNFAGGGGASTGITQAFGRPVDVAINHNSEAVAMHTANHPHTVHHCESVFEVDPEEITGNQPVGLAWFSPDCTHFSKAKGAAPRSPRVRGLAWVVIRWARRVKPRIIMLENVEEFQDWGPLLEDGRPCPERRGQTFKKWIGQLGAAGYKVEARQLRACDYGAPTTRKRLFVIARRDGLPIVWPAATHGPGRPLSYRPAAECIDWTHPCPSIFERARPLAENTLRRIARGVMRYVVNSADPFIVHIAHGEGRAGGPQRWGSGTHALDAPFPTITTKAEHMLAVPTLVQTGYGERPGQAPRSLDLQAPLGTVVGGQKHALVAAFLAKHYGDAGQRPGLDMREPAATITTTDHHALVTASTEGDHRERVHALLLKYYGSDQDPQMREPMHTVTTKHRFALVTVGGQQYAIADIGMRMLQPRELYRAQGFPEDYIIDFEHNGKPLTKSAQIRLCGNSVCPPLARALVQANFVHEQTWRQAVAA
jgi:DNA (cytosine-5)-methyltransferase 1